MGKNDYAGAWRLMRDKTASSGKIPLLNNTEKEQGLIPHNNRESLQGASYLCVSQQEDMLLTVCHPEPIQPPPSLQLNLPEEKPVHHCPCRSQQSLPPEHLSTSTATSGREAVRQQKRKQQVSASQQSTHSTKRRQSFSLSPVSRRSGSGLELSLIPPANPPCVYTSGFC